jgi:hypothetical protein
MKKVILTTMVLALIGSAGMFYGCSKSDEENKNNDWVYDYTVDGLIGEWYSSGDDVAPIFKTEAFGFIDSLYARFSADHTYFVQEYKEDGAKGKTYTGTYTQTKSSVGAIWTIVLNQNEPDPAVSEGIFEVTKVGDGYTMKYEIVQTSGTTLVAPTPSGGFGSSNAGAYGEWLVQKYVRFVK